MRESRIADGALRGVAEKGDAKGSRREQSGRARASPCSRRSARLCGRGKREQSIRKRPPASPMQAQLRWRGRPTWALQER
jgi:hypothetical protein